MPMRQLLLVSLVLIGVLLFVAMKVTQKPNSVSAEFYLTNGTSTLKDTPEIHVSEQSGNQLLLQLDLSYYPHAQFTILFQEKPFDGACLNIGDSPSNDGWGGDAGQFSNNAELQIISPSGGFLLYGSDAMLDAATDDTKSLLLKGEPALVEPKDMLTLDITDGKVAWQKGKTVAAEMESPYLFALNGQPDAKHGGANDHLIFAAFNRVIANPQNKGNCVEGVKVTLSRQ